MLNCFKKVDIPNTQKKNTITPLDMKLNYPESTPNIPADSQLVWIQCSGSSLGSVKSKNIIIPQKLLWCPPEGTHNPILLSQTTVKDNVMGWGRWFSDNMQSTDKSSCNSLPGLQCIELVKLSYEIILLQRIVIILDCNYTEDCNVLRNNRYLSWRITLSFKY